MAQIIRPQRGRDWQSIVLTGLTVGATGLLTASSSFGSPWTLLTAPPSLSNMTRSMSFTSDPERQEINAANTTQRNEVLLSDGASVTLDIFKVNNTINAMPLVQFALNFDYGLVQWVEGTAAGSIATWAVYGVRGQVQTGLQGRGEQVASLELGPCDVGAPTIPQVSVTFS